MSLNASSLLILGMVRNGVNSGYAIRRAVESMRMEAFWATTFAQIYPHLADLEDEGYLVRHDDPQGGRQRSAYTLSEKGEEALDAWLRSTDLPAMEVRDEGLLRLVFSDDLSREETLDLLRRLRERSEAAEREFREYNLPMAAGLAEQGYRSALMIARMGAEYHAWAAAWFGQLESELKAEVESSQAGPSAGD
jgi:PadR family transcriptional regulator, regulatory protein AphA